jgi:lysophospholipase L1-like esterase
MAGVQGKTLMKLNEWMKNLVPVTCGRYNMVLFLMVALLGFPFGAYAGNCPDSLVGYWKLDDSGANGKYLDSINAPNGNDGLCDTTCPSQLAQGESVVTQAQYFDGSSDGVTVPPATVFDWGAGDSFSIELWVKKSTAVAAAGEVLVARRDPDSQLLWKIELLPDRTVSFSLVSTGGQGSEPAASAKGSKIINNDRWHHIVAMRDADSDTNVIYVDGQQDGQSSAITYAANFGSATAGPTIGWMDATGPERFEGRLDEVAVYNRALTDKEIASHYYLSKDYCGLYDQRIRIMPLGDSISSGPPATNDSYRESLWNAMVNDAYYMNFVGSETGGTGFDPDHAGFGGLTTSGLHTLLSTGYNPDPSADGQYPGQVTTGPLLNTIPADVVLLHIGTNDLNDPFSSTLVTNVENVLNDIDVFSENVTVVLAEIINRVPFDSNTTTFNTAILGMVQNRIEDGDKIITLDMENDAGINYTVGIDFFDEWHPNAQGYAKMGDKWFTGLELFMPQFSAPLISAAPSPLVATIGHLFEFTVTSDGAPPPSFSLVGEAPSGMAIGDNGKISWTPVQDRDQVTITVQASNLVPQGTATLSLVTATDTRQFEITLNNAPVAVTDSYTTAQDGTLNVSAAAGILVNDTDPDSDPITASLVTTAANGVLLLNDDGSFNFTSDGSGATTDRFTYQAHDGKSTSAAATVTITIDQPPTSQVPDDSGGGGGGGGGGCFIGTAGTGESDLWRSGAWLAVLLAGLRAGFRIKGRGGCADRTEFPMCLNTLPLERTIKPRKIFLHKTT